MAAAGASRRFIEFFTANIRNCNTREAYARAVADFFRWSEAMGRKLGSLEPVHVAAYVEQLGKTHSAPSVKQHLAAVRAVRLAGRRPGGQEQPGLGGARAQARGQARQDARAGTRGSAFESLPTDTLVGLRDQALIGVLIYGFARISAALSMRVEDYFPQGKRWWLRLHEKGGKHHEMPVHHSLEAYLDAYVQTAGIGEDKKGWLFRSALGRTGQLSERALARANAFHMVQRRAKAAGLATQIGCHTNFL